MLIFRLKYFISFLLLLLIELFIALYVKDSIIRPWFGDVLVVILIYTFLRSFLKITYLKTIIIVGIFSFTIEFSQLFKLIELLGLENYQLAHWILGSSFNWWDFLAYALGLLLVFFIEKNQIV